MATTPARSVANRAMASQRQQSTPHSKGMSSIQSTDSRRNNPGNISRMKEDLKNKVDIPLESMLKALLAKPQVADADDLNSLQEAQKDGETQFNKILSEAIRFCNADLSEQGTARGKRCSRMKEQLRTFLHPEKETASYYPLAVSFNQALVCGLEDNADGVLFVPNDQIILESSQLRRDEPSAKRKPDLVVVQASHFRTWKDEWDSEDLGTAETQIVKGKHEAKGKKGEGKKPTWFDVLASVEVKLATGKPDFAFLEEVYTLESLSESSNSKEAPEINVGESRKRKAPATSHSTATSKKQKSTASSSGTQKLDLTVTPEVQCGYYGLERLRCTWNVTHGFVLLITGQKLQLQWYDPQGIILTDPVDIVRHLPLVVAMLFVFRDFDPGMWGTPVTKLSGEFEGVLREFQPKLSTVTPPGFHWVGRRTYTSDVEWRDACTPVEAAQASSSTNANGPNTRASQKRRPKPDASTEQPKPNTSTEQPPIPNAPTEQLPEPDASAEQPLKLDAQKRPFFFKASWPEISRDKEPHIVKEARERSDKYLGQYKAYVKEHIPESIGSDELKQTSTAIIRRLLKVGEEHCKPARVLLWMVSKKLEPITGLEPAPFWTAFREIIRCHYLLWRIGVAHGDISLRNLMYDPVGKKGILNDFDLSALMRPGDATHTPKGWQRTGTIPFMALALLRNHAGTIQRNYRHDLESFAWCLFWHCSSATEAEMVERCGSFRGALGEKVDLIHSAFVDENCKEALTSQWTHFRSWMWWWKLELDKITAKQFEQSKGKVGGDAHVAVDAELARAEAFNEDKRYLEESWSFLQELDPIDQDADWINFYVVDDVAISI